MSDAPDRRETLERETLRDQSAYRQATGGTGDGK